MNLGSWDWVWVVISALCIGLGKSGFGGAGMAAMLVMANILPARESTGVILPMLITADIAAVAIFRRHAVWKNIFHILPAACVGVVLGWLIMPRIPDAVFGVFLGWLILAMIALLIALRLSGKLEHLAMDHPTLAWPIGLLSGITTMLANAAGPVMTLYLLASRLPKMAFVGTGAWFFLIVNVFKVPFSAGLGLITPQSLLLNAFMVPMILAGVFLGRWLLRHISQSLFEALLLVFAVAAGLRMVFPG